MKRIKVSDHIDINLGNQKKDAESRFVKVNCPYCNSFVNNIPEEAFSLTIIWQCENCKKDYLFNHTGGSVLISKLDWVVEENRLHNLHNLPSEQQEAVKKAIEKLEKTGELSIVEPCDCGSHIQHNNGGNYHDWYDIEINEGMYFVKAGCTSELEPPYTWESSTKEKVYQLIQDCADWL